MIDKTLQKKDNLLKVGQKRTIRISNLPTNQQFTQCRSKISFLG